MFDLVKKVDLFGTIVHIKVKDPPWGYCVCRKCKGIGKEWVHTGTHWLLDWSYFVHRISCRMCSGIGYWKESNYEASDTVEKDHQGGTPGQDGQAPARAAHAWYDFALNY